MTEAEGVVERVRVRLGDEIRSLLMGPDLPTEPQRLPPDDIGLFGPDSMTWRVHADSSMLIGGLRSLLLQTAHPLAMAGVAQHSAYRTDPWGRLHRTGAFVGATTYGPTADAEAAIEMVKRVHVRVRGIAPDGRPYHASDPELITWVHITEVDSFLRAFQRYSGNPLDPDEADAYVGEMATIADRLGGREVPRDTAELRERLSSYRSELRASDQSREAVRFLIAPPVTLTTRGPYALLSAAAVGLLPRFVRRMLRLPSVPAVDHLMVRPAATTLLLTVGWALGPPPSLQAAEARLS